jgi:2-hydroxychromene-2-carboxylate isomerase
MTRLSIPVYYDFASTISYVAHRVMAGLAAEVDALGLDLEWRAIDMVVIAGWPRGVVVEGPRRENALRVARDLGVVARMPAYWIDSRPAACVARALAGTPREIAWRERVWSAVFEEGRDIGAEGEIDRLAADLALDVAGLVDEAALVRLETDTRAARAEEVTGVPTFDLGFPLGGIQEPATMLNLFTRWAANRRR